MTAWQIYLFTRLGSINTILGIAFGVGLLLSLCLIIAYLISYMKVQQLTAEGITRDDSSYFKEWDSWLSTWRSLCKKVLPVYIIVVVLAVAVPTQKEVAAIYLIPKVANNEDMQKIPADAAKIMRLKLDEWVKDLSPQPTEAVKK